MSRKLLILLSCFLFVFVVVSAGRAAPPSDSALDPGKLTVARLSDIQTLDPALAYDSASAEVLGNVYDTLVTADAADATAKPALATGWTVSADGLTYTFPIRSGVAFHNGAILSPSDVAYSLRRGLLQSDPGSPQWTLIGPIMGYGSGDITEEIGGGAYYGDPQGLRENADPTELLATCEIVKARVAADDVAGTVTITLAQPYGSFLSILTEYGYVINAAWASAQGDWDGDCATWQNFYAPSNDQGSQLAAVANGTGGFQLESWTPDESIHLGRYGAYWRPRPQSAVPLDAVVIRVIVAPATIADMLINGEADLATVLPDQITALDGEVLLEYPTDGQPVLRHADGVLSKLSGIPFQAASGDLFLNFNIATDGQRNYIGSGMLDGAGIPPDFFNDIHARRAFAYAFDYDAFDQAFDQGGIRRTGPIVRPLMGYDSSQSVYDYNPAQAEAELAQAWGGQVAANGLRFTLAYNEGNTARQMLVELLEAGIEALDPKYQIDVISLPFGDYLADSRTSSLPIFNSGWIQDYPHPDNWVRPYLIGTNALRQSMPDEMRQGYEQQANMCLSLLDAAARNCYETLQAQAYADTATIYTFQTSLTNYARSEVHGLETARRVNNTINFSQLWKGGSPAAGDINGTQEQTLNVAGASGTQLTLTFPTGAVNTPQVILAQPDVSTASRPTPDDLKLAPLSFSLTGWASPTMHAADLVFATPVEVKILYTAAQITPLIESELVLMRWGGDEWVPAACDEETLDQAANMLRVPICETGEFALMGPTHDAKVPVVMR